MSVQFLFTDGSVDPGRRVGVGAALLVSGEWLARDLNTVDAREVAARCVVRRFADTSSTQLELDTALWALSDIAQPGSDLTLLTDSQCVAGLAARRSRLEATNYVSGRKGGELQHAERFRVFFRLCDERPIGIRKVAGHADYRYQDVVQRTFHFVDREARRQLKRWLRELADSRAGPAS